MSQSPLFVRAKAMVIKHRFTLQDAGMLAAVLVGGGFVAWQFDVFPNGTSGPFGQAVIEFDEIFALASLLFGIFAYTRLRAQKRETRRRVAAERHARALALEDPLTGLPNRRQFEEALKSALAALPRAGGSHAVLLLDLNGFKRINDVHGHPVGDEALIEVAARLRESVREGDLVARLGGDEFGVLALHIASSETATGIALRIIEALRVPLNAGGVEHTIGGAIGIALAPQDAVTREQVMRKADVALYRAKAEGRSALRFFEAEMDQRLRERDHLERDLRAAIGTPALRPFYQPLIDLKTGEITGFEALARWMHPKLGEIEPARFIPIADDTGIISELTDSLLRQACSEASAWSRPVPLSFNISPAQLKDNTLGLRLMNILAETGLPPSRLEIEITESALVHDLEAAQRILGGIRDTGVRIALDDFGTGYSSLYHLRNFKLDKIKIDRSFVESMGHDRDSAAIVRALIGLGSGLDLAVTAEGVESAEQKKLLIEQGCVEAQGYLFSHAVPAEQAEELLTGVRPALRGAAE